MNVRTSVALGLSGFVFIELYESKFCSAPDDAFEKNCGAKRSTEHISKTINVIIPKLHLQIF